MVGRWNDFRRGCGLAAPSALSQAMRKSLFVLASLLLSTSAFASTLEDLQTKIAPFISAGRSVREMSGETPAGGGASCMTHISVTPDEVEFFSTWGDSGWRITLQADDEISMKSEGNQLQIGVMRDGYPAVVTLNVVSGNIQSMTLEQTYKSLFFKRKISMVCNDQVSFIPKDMK